MNSDPEAQRVVNPATLAGNINLALDKNPNNSISDTTTTLYIKDDLLSSLVEGGYLGQDNADRVRTQARLYPEGWALQVPYISGKDYILTFLGAQAAFNTIILVTRLYRVYIAEEYRKLLEATHQRHLFFSETVCALYQDV